MERESKINSGLLPPEASFNPIGMFSTISEMIATRKTSSPNGAHREIPWMPEFMKLESQIASFRASLPPQMTDTIKAHAYGQSDMQSVEGVDSLIYLAHLIPALCVSFPTSSRIQNSRLRVSTLQSTLGLSYDYMKRMQTYIRSTLTLGTKSFTLGNI